MLRLLSENYGLIRFSMPADFEGRSHPYDRYMAEIASVCKISMQVLARPGFQAELFTVSLENDDRIVFSDIPWPYTLVFIFGYSITIHLSRSLRKEIHDRGGHLFHSINGSFNLQFQKNRTYCIISIHYAEDFVRSNLDESAQGIRARWELQSPVFYYSRARITAREVMELLSMLVLSPPNDLKEDFLDDELARAILMDFLKEEASAFQPAYLSAVHFETFYKERNALVKHALEAHPISRLLSLARIHHVALFRKRLRQLYDLNILEFITEFRMTSAMNLLTDPTLSIKEIAAMTGFASAFYFSRVFTNYFGFPPKTFHAKRNT